MPGSLSESPVLFSLLYIGGILVLFLGLGGLVWTVFNRRVWRKRQFEGRLAAAVEEQVDADRRLDEITAELAQVKEALQTLQETLQQGLSRVEIQIESLSVVPCTAVPSLEDEVARAYEQGQSIEELAQDLGRGQGEIELMIKMHQLRVKGGCAF